MAPTVPEGNTGHREIRVDRTLCMGSGQCAWYAPNTFDQDDETIAIVTDPQGDPEDAINTAVESCPTQALSFVAPPDGTGGNQE
jgi:ferredoxin